MMVIFYGELLPATTTQDDFLRVAYGILNGEYEL